MNDALDKARSVINEVDAEIAKLFKRRMNAVKVIAEYKMANRIKIYDPQREAEVIKRGVEMLEDDELCEYYVDFLKANMSVSRRFQKKLMEKAKTNTEPFCGVRELNISAEGGDYTVTVGRGLLDFLGDYLNLNRKVLIVTDSGVPKEYAEKVASFAKESITVCVDTGEGSKSLDTFDMLIGRMIEFGMTRSDCAVAVGGGVVGDLTGFAASTYMRGIDFYNLPTTLLSQVDSSIGGKTALNHSGIKNTVGAFYPPRAVVIDTEVLKTLPIRHFSCGLAEAIKMSVTSDAELFDLIERDGVTEENIDEIIYRSLKIKKSVVEEDERESGLRKILNFGHTFGHGIEALGTGLYHGECVAIGMTVAASDKVNARLIPVLEKYGLPTSFSGDTDAALKKVTHDKKRNSDGVDMILVDEIGTCRIENVLLDELSDRVKRTLNGASK